MKEYKPHVKAGAELVRVNLQITRGDLLVEEDAIVKEWESKDETSGSLIEIGGPRWRW